MTVVAILTLGALVGIGVWLLLDADVMRVVLGVALTGHAAVLLLVAARPAGRAPLVDGQSAPAMADAVPQALSLTAIVISFAVTTLLLALAGRVWSDRREEAAEAISAAADTLGSAEAADIDDHRAGEAPITAEVAQ